VQRPEHFGGIGISFLEPGRARIPMPQDFENLPPRARDCVAVFTQGRQFQHDALLVVWRALAFEHGFLRAAAH
jgi:hypothetical protein